MKFLIIGIVALGLAYWFLVRPVLRQRAELAGFFSKLDLIKAGWWARLRLMFSGIKTTLWARFLMLAGILVPLLDMIGATDLASLLPTIPVTDTYQLTPSQYVPIIVLPAIGFVTQKLRNLTTTPVGVPSADQVAAVIPDAPAAVVVAKAEQIAEAKAPPTATEGKE